MESQDIRRLAARFPEIAPGSRLPGARLGNLGDLPWNRPIARAKSPVLSLRTAPLISLYGRNKLIPPTTRPYFPNRIL